MGTNETLDPGRLCTFGCAAYVQTEKGLRDGKGGQVRWKGMFAGYSPLSPAWLILDPCSGRIREAYHVRFVESKPGLNEDRGGDAPQDREATRVQLVPQTMEKTQSEEGSPRDPTGTCNSRSPGQRDHLREGEQCGAEHGGREYGH